MWEFSNVWRKACSEDREQASKSIAELMGRLSTALDVDEVEYAHVESTLLYLIDFSRLGFKGMDLNIVMLVKPPETEDEQRAQAQLLEEYSSIVQTIGYCFVFFLSEDLPPTNPYITSVIDLVRVCGADLNRLFESHVPDSVLFEVIRRQKHLSRLCPFNITHEARSDTFRGRDAELERLVNDNDSNFLISGARRIGKTSLMKRAYNIIRFRRGFSGDSWAEHRTFYFNCLNWRSFQDCCTRLSHKIDPKSELRIQKNPLHNISLMLERRSRQGRRMLFLFFDEMDGVVERDEQNGWPFFNLLAQATSDGWIRVVFTGYRSMKHLIVERGARANSAGVNRARSPFHGSLDEIEIGTLTRNETFSLIEEPFRTVEIQITDRAPVLDHIWTSTGGYPFLIQFYGEQLFQLAYRSKSNEITLGNVKTVEGGFALSDYVETHFLDNTRDKGNPAEIERTCAWALAQEDPGVKWTQVKFYQRCGELLSHPPSIDKVNDGLRNLYYARIFTFENDHYALSLPILQTKIRNAFPELKTLLTSDQ
jgi:hypothetical protein